MDILDTRNLTMFRRHLPADCLHADFAASFGFRTDGSHFSVLNEPGGVPGPDETFAHVQLDSRKLFEKLLGLSVEFPAGRGRSNVRLYSSANHYRSHLQQFFIWTAPQHQAGPPLEGECLIFFGKCDELVVQYRLRNISAAEIPIKLAFNSRPCADRTAKRKITGNGFCFGMEQKVLSYYRAWMRVECDDKKIRFLWRNGLFCSSPVGIVLRGHELRTWTFRCTFSSDGPPVAAAGATGTLKGAISRAGRSFENLPRLPGEDRRFHPLVLRSAGILMANRSLEYDSSGREVMTIHAGKCGVEATWWWDGAIHLLGLGLCGDRRTIRGTVNLLLGGLKDDGEPVVRFCNGSYSQGAQMPILAWGLMHAQADAPDPALIKKSYPRLVRYVRWWLGRRSPNGLATLPAGCTAQDDSPRWSENFPISWPAGIRWDSKSWGQSRPDQFECPDVNAHLYLELKSLGRMARELGLSDDALQWEGQAAALARAINRALFDPDAGTYQDRHIASGRFTGYITAGSFLPFYAGIATRRRASFACRRYLLDPERFYTTLPFAGADRAHPAFRAGGRLYEVPKYPGALLQSSYWLGRVWPQYGYWLAAALWRAGLKREADAAADKILDTLLPQESLYECYDPLTASGNGHAEFSWTAASVLALAYRCYRRGPI